MCDYLGMSDIKNQRMQNSVHGHLFTPVNKIRCAVVLVNVPFALTKPTSTFKHCVVFKHIVGFEKRQTLILTNSNWKRFALVGRTNTAGNSFVFGST